MATGPALCSPLKGVGFDVSKVQPFLLASFGSLNQKPTWKLLVGGQCHIGIEAEDLVEQDGLDRGLEMPQTVRLQVTLVPGETEVGEIRIRVSVREQVAALHGEHVEGQMRAEVKTFDGESIGEGAPLDVN